MSSQWTNKYAIIRDLSLAQGFEVPVDLSDTVAAGEKPPTLNIPEENEDAFFNHGEVGDGNTVPDLTLIQHMLKMVHPVSDSEDENYIIEISKPSHSAKEPSNESKVEIVTSTPPENKLKKKLVKKQVKKKRVNVAVNSILQGLIQIDQATSEPKKETMTLLKPTDFMSKEETLQPETNLKSTEYSQKVDASTHDKVNEWLLHCDSASNNNSIASIAKVNNCFDSANKNSSKKCENIWNFEPASMFKKKNVVAKPSKSSSVETSPVLKDPIANYKPSELADEYYRKYLEHSKLKEMVQDNIWTQAEKIMKEIDAKKTIEAIEAPFTQLQEEVDREIITSCDQILLPQHRHMLTGICIVCEVVKRNGIDIDSAIFQNTESVKLKCIEGDHRKHVITNKIAHDNQNSRTKRNTTDYGEFNFDM